jgi:hypothetical protein
MDTPGTLADNEFHPAASGALSYIQQHASFMDLEALASTALSGNRLAEVCSETLRRILENEPVSDRYVLGLAWTLRQLRQKEDDGNSHH